MFLRYPQSSQKLNRTSVGRLLSTDKDAFTLAELLIAAVVMILTFGGILFSYLKCLELAEISRNSSTAVHASKSRMEQIKNTTFDQIKATYNNTTFLIAGLTGTGVSYVDDTNPNLLKITITICWRQSNNRIFGEDTNMNGILNVGEDKNANAMLDSPTTMVSYIFQ